MKIIKGIGDDTKSPSSRKPKLHEANKKYVLWKAGICSSAQMV